LRVDTGFVLRQASAAEFQAPVQGLLMEATALQVEDSKAMVRLAAAEVATVVQAQQVGVPVAAAIQAQME
jgi:hypothetical protein